MVQPSGAQCSLYLPDCLLESVSEIVFVEGKNSPPGGVECLVSPPVAEGLGIEKVMSAVVLNGEASMTVTKISGGGHSVADP